MRRKMIGAFTVLACVGLFSGSAFAAAVSEEQAKNKVSGYLPQGSTYLGASTEHGIYELTYVNDSKKEMYEYDVDMNTGAIISFESKQFNHRGSDTVSLSTENVKGVVTKEVPGVEILEVYLDYDDATEYEVRVRSNSWHGKYTIHPQSGAILEREIKAGTGIVATSAAVPAATTVQNATPVAATTQGQISMEQAKNIALSKAPGGVVVKCELDFEYGRTVYEVEVRNGRWEYDFDIDASNGSIITWDKDYDD